jgi:hypothetical protein
VAEPVDRFNGTVKLQGGFPPLHDNLKNLSLTQPRAAHPSGQNGNVQRVDVSARGDQMCHQRISCLHLFRQEVSQRVKFLAIEMRPANGGGIASDDFQLGSHAVLLVVGTITAIPGGKLIASEHRAPPKLKRRPYGLAENLLDLGSGHGDTEGDDVGEPLSGQAIEPGATMGDHDVLLECLGYVELRAKCAPIRGFQAARAFPAHTADNDPIRLTLEGKDCRQSECRFVNQTGMRPLFRRFEKSSQE